MASITRAILSQMGVPQLLCVFIITFVCKTSSSSICDSLGQRYRTQIQERFDEVLTYDKLNLILLLDVSASIGFDLYRREVETFAIELVEYGIRKSGMILHEDHAHIEVVTFDDIAKVQNTSPKPIHACEIYARLEELSPGQFDGRTEVHVAFNTTRELFRTRQRPGDTKVLFLVTDGGFTSKSAAVRTSVGQLRALGVEIFTIGVGPMTSSWISDNLDTVVLDDLHFMCYSSWADMIHWSRDKPIKDVTWADVTQYQLESSCPACVTHSRCQCAVNVQEYKCRCDIGYFKNAQGSCIECSSSCADDEVSCLSECMEDRMDQLEDGTHISSWMLIVAVLACVSLLLAVVIVLVVIRWRRHMKSHHGKPPGIQAFFKVILFKKVIKNMNTIIVDDTVTKREPNEYVTPTSRPCSLSSSDIQILGTDIVRNSRRPEIKEIHDAVDPVSVCSPTVVQRCIEAYEARGRSVTDAKRTSTILAVTGPDVDTAREYNTSQYVQTACHRQSSASSHAYMCISPASRTEDEEGYQIPVSYNVIPDDAELGHYENIDTKAHAWITDLDRLVDTTDIDGAAIFCKDDDSLATTDNFTVRASDIGHIMRLLNGDTENGAVFPLNGKMHEIRIHHRGNCMYADEIPGGKDKSATWILNTEHLLVIGSGIRAMTLSCEQSIGHFAVEIEKECSQF